jgi:hypothetical protein
MFPILPTSHYNQFWSSPKWAAPNGPHQKSPRINLAQKECAQNQSRSQGMCPDSISPGINLAPEIVQNQSRPIIKIVP